MRTHEERVLVAGLGGLNADLSRFVLKAIQADHAGTQWPHTAEDEAELALRMATLVRQLEIHAKQQRIRNEAQPTIVINSDSASHQLGPGTQQ